MDICKLPQPLVTRIKNFSEIHWRNNYKMNQSVIFDSLPATIRSEIKTFMFTPLIKSWEVVIGGDIGEIVSIINELELVTFPENEFIVKFGEVADEMYFIVEGICQVEAKDGSAITVIKQG
jgi:hypothetical protein